MILKCYKDTTGKLHRTQAEAKACGQPFKEEIVPNDQQGLIDYINAIRDQQAPEYFPDDEDDADHLSEIIEIGSVPFDPAKAYRNGDPTTPFLKSRDPAAIFTCTSCGASNVNR